MERRHLTLPTLICSIGIFCLTATSARSQYWISDPKNEVDETAYWNLTPLPTVTVTLSNDSTYVVDIGGSGAGPYTLSIPADTYVTSIQAGDLVITDLYGSDSFMYNDRSYNAVWTTNDTTLNLYLNRH